MSDSGAPKQSKSTTWLMMVWPAWDSLSKTYSSDWDSPSRTYSNDHCWRRSQGWHASNWNVVSAKNDSCICFIDLVVCSQPNTGASIYFLNPAFTTCNLMMSCCEPYDATKHHMLLVTKHVPYKHWLLACPQPWPVVATLTIAKIPKGKSKKWLRTLGWDICKIQQMVEVAMTKVAMSNHGALAHVSSSTKMMR